MGPISDEEYTVDFKNLANKALDLAQQNADKVETVIDKAGDLVDQKTDGKFASQVDSAQEAAKKALHQQK
ncbi:antitoxin [Nocardia sp. NPDC057030]|uniref:antitoxin n=1 Tax=unclassified Nocardia TaxID=2637762 RepID=UPI00363C28D0